MLSPKRCGRWPVPVLLAVALVVTLAATAVFRPAPSAPASTPQPVQPPRPVQLPQPVQPPRQEDQPPQPVQHPRLFFTRQDIPGLRNQAQTTHREIWQPVLAFARSQLNSNPPGPPAEGDLDGYRNAGNEVIAFAFAYTITGDPAYLDLTHRYMQAYTTWPDWGDEGGYGNRDLGFHHMLLGYALAYDWIYNDLSETDRATLGAILARRAQESYEASHNLEYRWNNWWREAYTQNHNWTNHSALGVAALALDGYDPRTPDWLAAAIDDMTKIRYLLEGVGDGSWHEGIPYQTYGLTMSLPFLQNLRKLKGVDLFPHTYLRNYVDWRAYNSLPGSAAFALSYSDFEWTWANSYGPEGVLRFAAAEYRDGHAEWLAQQMVKNIGRQANVYSAPWYVFEFLYYDPTIAASPPDDLYPNRTFPDLEGVIWRTGWGASDLVFGLKTGAPAGRFAYTRFTNGKQYPFDPNSKVDLFHSGHDHDDANTFYLYRGGVDLASETVGYQLTGTSYHNTLLVDGQGQYRTPDSAQDAGRNPELVRAVDGKLGAVYGSKDFSFLVADATSRYRSTDPKTGKPGAGTVDGFQRHVLFVKPGYLVMVDNVRAASPHQYDWISHFGASVSMEGDWVKGIADKSQILGVKIVAPTGFATSVGNDGKPYVRIRPSSPAANTRFVTVLYPTDVAGWQSRPAISPLGDDGQATGVRVVLNGTQDHLIKYGDQMTATVGEYSFDGQSASVDKDSAGGLQRLFLGNGSKLADQRGARALIRAPGKISALQVDYQEGSLAVYGDNLGGISIYAPGAGVDRVTVNGQAAPASKNGDYVVLHP